jgi:TolB protein
MKTKLAIFLGVVILGLIWLPKAIWKAQAAQLHQMDSQVERHQQIYDADNPSWPTGESAKAAIPLVEPVFPNLSVPYSKIVFQSFRDSNWEIYLADGNGGSHARLTSDGASDLHPRLNPGCTKIVFASRRANSGYEIFSMNLDGTGVTRLTNNGNADDVNPNWSPDGKRILYQSYQDGQAEIYTMNADGTGQIRLTNSSAYEGMPAWSPDGSRIAFVSNRAGPYLLYVMMADGSSPNQLSSQPYSSNPAWSPDGSQIAYDADGDNDGWQELWLVNAADGSNPHELYGFGGMTDAWARSWSPDGRYIAFTGISFIYDNGWYWTDAFLYAYDTTTGQASKINGAATEWNPDWKSTDTSAPTTSIQALLSPSASPIKVKWSGIDNGPAGIKSYFLQVKDGITGTWADWFVNTSETSAYYLATGGHTYYFRVRAIDNGGNMEPWPPNYDAAIAVENQVPQAWFRSLGAYHPNQAMIEWDGLDNGGSGIRSYDVQYRDTTGGDWVNWQTGTGKTYAYFQGTTGHTYQFRVRAMDQAKNQGYWFLGGQNAQTILCQWTLSGTITDNAGVPVMGAAISTSPASTRNETSNISGDFAACINEPSNQFTTSWSKSGYGSLPATLSAQPNTVLNVALPPGDNLLPNGDFETPFVMTTSNGVAVSSLSHTGQYSLRLSPLEETRTGKATRLQHTTGSGYWAAPSMVFDSKGLAHLAWRGGDEKIYYATVSSDGVWASQMLSSPAESAYSPQILIDFADRVHVLWKSGGSPGNIYLATRETTGQWSTPVVASRSIPGYIEEFQAQLDQQGNLYIIWQQAALTYSQRYIFFAWRNVEGTWSLPVDLMPLADGAHPQIVIDQSGRIHVASLGSSVFYLTSNDFGITWAKPEALKMTSSQVQGFSLAVDQYGNPAMAWSESFSGIVYSKRTNGVWSSPIVIIPDSRGGYSSAIRLATLGNGRAFILGSTYTDLYYAYQDLNGDWQPPEYVDPAGVQFSVNKDTVYLSKTWGTVTMRQYRPDGSWQSYETLAIPDRITSASIANRDGVIHLAYIWSEHSNSHYISYWDFPLATQDEIVQHSQTLTVPVSMNAPTLSFFYRLFEWYDNDSNNFEVSVNDGASTTSLLSTSKRTNDWQHAWFDLSPWAGQAITITFTARQAANQAYLWAYLDDITVGSAHTDVWVNAHAGLPAVLPGEQLVYEITYGNRGAAGATGNVITHSLPAELTFVSASLPATIQGKDLVWQVSDLPAGASPFTIQVTATVQASVPLGSSILLPVQIATVSSELETGNNSATHSLFIGRLIFLPCITKQ